MLTPFVRRIWLPQKKLCNSSLVARPFCKETLLVVDLLNLTGEPWRSFAGLWP